MRPVVLGNQRLLVNLDDRGFVRDIYYKRVGQENHVLGKPHRIAVWADFRLSWLDEPEWKVTMHSENTLCTKTIVRNDARDITITFNDAVLQEEDVFIRRITSNRHVRLFVYHYFFLYGDGIGDTASFDPKRNLLFHYKRKRYFAVNAFDGNKSVLADYTVGVPFDGQEAWRDALDGELSKNPIAQGHVDSCVAFNVLEGQKIDYVLCAAKDFTSMRLLHDKMLNADRTELIHETKQFERDYCAIPVSMRELKDSWKRIYSASLLLVRAHTDKEGAIVAGADSENMLFNRDTYTYAWGRDNAIIARAMDTAGKNEITRAYYDFMRRVIEPEGFYMHKHHPDGSLGSSWQAWIRNGEPYLPIQEDETALQLWALKKHHELVGDDYVREHYDDWITKMIDFLIGHMREDVPLPRDSWDLWEERQGIHTWTVASVVAGLQAGEFFARLHDDDKRADACKTLSEKLLNDGLLGLLYSKQYNRFIRRLTPELQPDLTIDAADLAPFVLGILPAEHEAVVGTIKAVEANLHTPDGGIARYQGDYFHRKTEDAPGNPWTFCTLWVANWHITQRNWQRADELIDWVVNHAVGSGMLGEQFHPLTGEPLAVCPLTWAHAEFIVTMHLYVSEKQKEQKEKG